MAILKSFVLGASIGLGLAFVLEYFDDKITTLEQVEQLTSLPVLGIIPKVRKLDEELADPRSALSEAHRSLCTALQFSTEGGVPKTLTITSSGPGEGKSLAAMAIARHFAGLGRKVLLVDADLRNPSQHVKLGYDNSVGLSNYLTGACTPPEAIQKTDIPTLAFMASGPLPPSAADLLGGARLVSLLSVGLEVFDIIIVDGPPVMEIADAQLLSSAAAATLFIVGAGKARKKLVRGAIRRLQLARGYVVGAVLTQYSAKAAGYGYGYGEGYGYGYGYGQQASTGPSGLSVQIADHSEQPRLITGQEST